MLFVMDLLGSWGTLIFFFLNGSVDFLSFIKLFFFFRDLLDKSKKQYELRQNESGVYVKNLQSYVCKSAKEIEHVMNVGNQNRTVG